MATMSAHFIFPVSQQCSTYRVRRNLRRNAVPKDGSHRNKGDYNLLFPPTVIETSLDIKSVADVLNCSCPVCARVIIKEPVNDHQLIHEITQESGSRELLAILVYMRAGCTMRLLHRNGLGIGNNFDVGAVFAGNHDLKFQLFRHIPAPPGILANAYVDEIATRFCAEFSQMKQLFKSPFFKDSGTFKEIPNNSNLPFLRETELRNRESSYARLYKFEIHEEFCSPALKVCTHLFRSSFSQH